MPKGKILMGKKSPKPMPDGKKRPLPMPKDKPNGKKRPLPMPRPMPKPKDKPGQRTVEERNFIRDQMQKSRSRGSNPRNKGGIVDPKRNRDTVQTETLRQNPMASNFGRSKPVTRRGR